MARQHDRSTDTPARRQIISVKTTAREIDKSERTIKRWEDAGLFPKRVRVGPNSVGHFVDEVEQWKAALDRRPGDRPPSGKPTDAA